MASMQAARRAAALEPANRTQDQLRELAEYLGSVKLPGAFGSDQLDALSKAAILKEFSAGEAIFGGDRLKDRFYIVLAGSVSVQVPTQSGSKGGDYFETALILNQGARFGELALFAQQPGGTKIVAEEASELLVLFSPSTSALSRRWEPHEDSDVADTFDVSSMPKVARCWTQSTGGTQRALRKEEPCLPPSMQIWTAVKRRVPVLDWLPRYNFKDNFFGDVTGGATIGLVCMAQTLAHAAIATTEDIQGPYCAFVPTLVYALLGTSPHAAISSGAIVAILIADYVRPWAHIKDRTEVASLLALISGAVMMLMGVFKLSFAVRFLSQPTLSGFITGGAVLIVVQQAHHLFGLQHFPHVEGVYENVTKTIEFLPHMSWISLVVGLAALALLECFNRLKVWTSNQIKNGDANSGAVRRAKVLRRMTEMKELLVAALGILVGFATAHPGPGGTPIIPTVGHIPSGLPDFQPPWKMRVMDELWDDKEKFAHLITGSVLMALTSFLSTYATTKKVAIMQGYNLDASQEMVSLGIAGVAGSFFGAFPPSGSLSRTGLAAECGVKTQMGGVFSAGIVCLGLVFLTPALRFLPKTVLAALIMKSSVMLLDFDTPRQLWHYWKPQAQGGLRRDFVVWGISFVCTMILGVIYGIGLAVLTSVILIVADSAVPYAAVLGHVDTPARTWRDVKDWPEARLCDGVLVFEFRGPLSFASTDFFQEEVERARAEAEAAGGEKVKIVVLSFVSTHLLDSTACRMLEDLLLQWRKAGLTCIIAGADRQVRGVIEEWLVMARLQNRVPVLLDQPDFTISTSEAVAMARQRLEASLAVDLEMQEPAPLSFPPPSGTELAVPRSRSAMPPSYSSLVSPTRVQAAARRLQIFFRHRMAAGSRPHAPLSEVAADSADSVMGSEVSSAC